MEKFMEMEGLHKKLLIEMGLKGEDFPLSEAKHVTYEYEAEKGVRLYDPYFVPRTTSTSAWMGGVSSAPKPTRSSAMFLGRKSGS
jgi:hypothetical protein